MGSVQHRSWRLIVAMKTCLGVTVFALMILQAACPPPVLSLPPRSLSAAAVSGKRGHPLGELPRRRTICPDGHSECPQNYTCCPLDNWWLCCPLIDAVCCAETRQCCESGYWCNPKSGACVPDLRRVHSLGKKTEHRLPARLVT